MMEDPREFIYQVDAQNRILFANQNWFAFARENGATNLAPTDVIGQVIWGFPCNSETRHPFEILLQKVRATGVTAGLPFRCDAPDRRRFMELQILLRQNQELEFRSRILRQELRDSVRLMEPDVERTNTLLVMCGWCKQVQLPDECWVEVEAAIKALRLFSAPRLPRISHGICQLCVAAFNQVLAQNVPAIARR